MHKIVHIRVYYICHRAFPGGASDKQSAANARDATDSGSIPGQEEPLEEENGNPPTPVFLPEKFHGREEPAGLPSIGHKELDMNRRLNTCAHMCIS